MNRRDILKSAPIAALMCAISAENVDASVDLALADEAEATAADLILHHVEQITKILREDAPCGTRVQGFQFKMQDDQISYDSIFASAISENCHLYWMRPTVFEGWRNVTPKIA